MSGVRIVIDDADVMNAINQLERVANNPAQIMADVAAALLQSTQRRFELETAPDGQKWKALSPRTANARAGKGRRKRGYGNILRRSNRLYSSLTAQSDNNSAVVGTNVVYAGIHQFGGEIQKAERQQTIHMATIKGRNRFVRAGRKRKRSMDVTMKAHQVIIPERPYLGINDADKAMILTAIEDGLRREAGV